MKKIKLIVIFFFAIFSVFIIYKYTFKDNNNLLILGENIEIKSKKYNIQKYLYDNITYKELIRCIKNNEEFILKNKKTSINQLISKSSIIVINANNIEYLKKCKKKNNIYIYKNTIEKDKKRLIDYIKKISNSKIIIIDNTCNKSTDNIDKIVNIT